MAGVCGFDLTTLSFTGDAEQQALCLVRPVLPVGRLGPVLEKLPDGLAGRVGTQKDLPDRDALRALISERGFDKLAAGLSGPVSHANDSDPLSRSATYMILHDT